MSEKCVVRESKLYGDAFKQRATARKPIKREKCLKSFIVKREQLNRQSANK